MRLRHLALTMVVLFLAVPAMAQVPVPLCVEEGNDDRCETWAATFDGSGRANDAANGIEADPAGERVFVTGTSYTASADLDVVTVAYRASDGAELWQATEARSGNDDGRFVAVTPDGETVLVGGSGGPSGLHVMAYRASNGELLWSSVHETGRSDRIEGLVLSQDGGTAFVTGWGSSTTEPTFGVDDYDYVTVAFDVASGSKVWSARYQGAAQFWDIPQAIDVGVVPGSDPPREIVAVAGRSSTTGKTNNDADIVTVAYDGSTGQQVWERAYDGPAHGREYPFALDVSGDSVFVTGESWGQADDYVTISYDLDTGSERWATRRDVAGSDRPLAILASDTAVYVTGHADCCLPERILTVVAYDRATGDRLWEKQRSGPTGEVGHELALSPDAETLYVGGMRGGHVVGTGFNISQAGLGVHPQAGYARFLLIALDTATGAQEWAAQHEGGTFTGDIALTQDGKKLFITGGGQSSLSGDYTTAAYLLQP